MPRVFTLTLYILLALPAQGEKLPVWQLDGTANPVLLLGSVHLLRAGDYPLEPGFDAVYAKADDLTTEFDATALDPREQQTVLLQMSVDPSGRTLRDYLGNANWARAAALSEDLGIPLAAFSQFEPWFAALSISQAQLAQMGFEPQWGIEHQFTSRAVKDGKPVGGLETLEEQLGFLDRLAPEAQARFFLQTLEDARTVEDSLDAIVGAWRSGDTDTLAELMLDSMENTPAAYDALIVQRNRNWVDRILAIGERPGTHLVVVGAMHLVGEDSLLNMLNAEGVTSRQLGAADLAAD